MSGLGFDESDLAKSPAELSSGYQIRLNLAKVLVSRPDLLLLDEPTNYLDIVSVRWLGRFLREWKGQLILITHDRAFMDSVVTHVMGIHRKGIRKIAGSTHKLYAQILQEEEVYEKTRLNDERKRKELEQFINRFRAQATRARAVQSKIKMLEKKEGREEAGTAARTLDFQFPAAPFSGKWLMEVMDLAFCLRPGGPPLIDGLTFAVARRDRIGVIGKNGKGKTTLLGLLAGDLAPHRARSSRSAGLQDGLFRTGEYRPPGRGEHDRGGDHAAPRPMRAGAQARNICGLMLFEGDLALKKIAVLSGGEKSRVLLGKMLVTPSNLPPPRRADEPPRHGIGRFPHRGDRRLRGGQRPRHPQRDGPPCRRHEAHRLRRRQALAFRGDIPGLPGEGRLAGRADGERPGTTGPEKNFSGRRRRS